MEKGYIELACGLCRDSTPIEENQIEHKPETCMEALTYGDTLI